MYLPPMLLLYLGDPPDLNHVHESACVGDDSERFALNWKKQSTVNWFYVDLWSSFYFIIYTNLKSIFVLTTTTFTAKSSIKQMLV